MSECYRFLGLFLEEYYLVLMCLWLSIPFLNISVIMFASEKSPHYHLSSIFLCVLKKRCLLGLRRVNSFVVVVVVVFKIGAKVVYPVTFLLARFIIDQNYVQKFRAVDSQVTYVLVC